MCISLKRILGFYWPECWRNTVWTSANVLAKHNPPPAPRRLPQISEHIYAPPKVTVRFTRRRRFMESRKLVPTVLPTSTAESVRAVSYGAFAPLHGLPRAASSRRVNDGRPESYLWLLKWFFFFFFCEVEREPPSAFGQAVTQRRHYSNVLLETELWWHQLVSSMAELRKRDLILPMSCR